MLIMLSKMLAFLNEKQKDSISSKIFVICYFFVQKYGRKIDMRFFKKKSKVFIAFRTHKLFFVILLSFKKIFLSIILFNAIN